MSIKVGDKYVVEIGAIAELPDGKKKYFIKPFESLVFDRRGLEQLERLDKATGNIYQTGFEDGKKQAIEEIPELANKENEIYNDGYNKGIEDFENLFVHEHDYEQFFEDTYGSKDPDYNLFDLVVEYGAKKVLKDFKKWQEEKKKAEEIKVGDVVKFNEKCHNYDHVKSREFLVLHVFDNGLVTLLYDNGDTGAADRSLLDKTSRHIDEVEQILDKLGDENND